MSQNCILLLTASPPGVNGVGQLFLRSVCRLSTHSFATAALLGRQESHTPSPEFKEFPYLPLERRYEPALRPLGREFGGIAAAAAVHFRLLPYVESLLSSTIDFARRYETKAIWAVLDCPTSMLMGAPLAERLKLPLYSLVWDMPQYLLPRLGHTGRSLKLLQKGFGDTLRRSRRVAVMSTAMKSEFEENFKVPCTILHQPIDPDWNGEESSMVPRDDEFVIGFAGSVSAKDEMELLLKSLDSVGWNIEGRQVKLRIYGLRFVCQSKCAQWVEYRGYRETKDVVAGLAQCDLLFLPQPFSAALRPFSRYSFPTKAVTYLAARRPLLILAPEDSALVAFFQEGGISSTCVRYSQADIIEHLRQFVRDGNAEDVRLQLRGFAAAEFSVQRCRERLSWLFSEAPVGQVEQICR